MDLTKLGWWPVMSSEATASIDARTSTTPHLPLYLLATLEDTPLSPFPASPSNIGEFRWL